MLAARASQIKRHLVQVEKKSLHDHGIRITLFKPLPSQPRWVDLAKLSLAVPDTFIGAKKWFESNERYSFDNLLLLPHKQFLFHPYDPEDGPGSAPHLSNSLVKKWEEGLFEDPRNARHYRVVTQFMHKLFVPGVKRSLLVLKVVKAG